MIRTSIFIASIIGLLLWSSCRKDFEYRETEGRLEFSKDTVYLDTVFTNIGSSTYRLKVYNRTGDDIIIPTISLAQGQNSSYRLNVDGQAGQVFQDVSIMAKDSMFIFIETTFDISQINQSEFLYTDQLQFIGSSSLQEVPLVTLIKDAIFLYPSELSDGSKETIVFGVDNEGNEIKVEGFVLEDDQLNFTNEKPYVIYGYAAVPENKTLQIGPGSRIHFHKDSGLLVGEGGSLRINGELSEDPELLEKEVIIEGDRLEPELTETPAQWGTIWLVQGSRNHYIDFCTIRNATVGLLVEGQTGTELTLEIKNTKIYNSGSVNLWSRTSRIEAENLVLGNAGEASLFCEAGGDYTFLHSTIANYWSNSFRSGAALRLTNYSSGTNGPVVSADLENASFLNCIVGGNTAREFSLLTNETNSFNFNFSNCLMKFHDTSGQFENNPLYDFENPVLYSEIVLNEEPNFNNTARNNFQLKPGSAAIDIGNIDTALLVPLDVLGENRTIAPDSGAYEQILEE